MQVNQVRIEKLQNPEHAGDWHDKPLRWAVIGPVDEVQKFSTKKDATLYARIRRRSTSWQQAHHSYLLAA